MASDLKLPYQQVALNDASDPDLLDLDALRFGGSVESKLDASSKALQALLDADDRDRAKVGARAGAFGVADNSFSVRQPH